MIDETEIKNKTLSFYLKWHAIQSSIASYKSWSYSSYASLPEDLKGESVREIKKIAQFLCDGDTEANERSLDAALFHIRELAFSNMSDAARRQSRYPDKNYTFDQVLEAAEQMVKLFSDKGFEKDMSNFLQQHIKGHVLTLDEPVETIKPTLKPKTPK